MRKIVLTYGLIAGAILSVMMLLTLPFMEQIGFSRGEVIGYTTMVLAFLMIYFGVRSYRDQVAGGSITFGRACKVGGLIVLVAATCYMATWQLVYYKLAPNFFAQYSAYTLEQAKAEGATDAEVAAKRAEMEEFRTLYQNPLVNIGFTFLEPLPVGLLHTLISAGLLSRKRRPDESTA
jgi:hypothetical protein